MPTSRRLKDRLSRARRIRLLLLDVDGVMTHGEIMYDARGTEIKRFNVYDGSAIWLAQKAGLRVGFLSGRSSPVVEVRARELRVTLVRQGSRDKLGDGRAMARKLGITLDEVAFLGDDVMDVPLLRAVGLAAAVANARPEAKKAAHYVTRERGGEGAVRELIEYLLKAQKKWASLLAPFLDS